MKDLTRLPTNLPALAERLKVLAEPKRLLIVHLLMEGVQCNCELGDAQKLPPNLISHTCGCYARRACSTWNAMSSMRAGCTTRSIAPARRTERRLRIVFDPARIEPRRPTYGPQGALVKLSDITVN